MRKVTYISHSGFLVELASCALLFDYEKGEIPPIDKPLYVFVSHAHHDHYNAYAVEKLRNLGAVIILSDDIVRDKQKRMLFVHPNTSYQLDHLHIECLTSTDEGVAFLVQVDQTTIYHAGDLHWWHWEESTPQENEKMKQAYVKELHKLKGKHIDIAFVPVDPRLEHAFYYGIDAFAKEVDVSILFPMHVWQDYQCIQALKALPLTQTYRNRIMDIHKEGDVFEV